uniref:Uncharacterized protein n=1 Tax=Strigamia maritima TaxID=126957 RepID=T1JJC0_STRMM
MSQTPNHLVIPTLLQRVLTTNDDDVASFFYSLLCARLRSRFFGCHRDFSGVADSSCQAKLNDYLMFS